MPRIRYLKPDFFKDEDLAEHPYWIRLLFAGLWGIADKDGRLEDRIKRIKAEIFPYDTVDIEKGLGELSKNKQYGNQPFIQRYEINGEKFIQIVNWGKHQKPHHTEKESEIPPAPPLNTMEKGMGNGECSSREYDVKQRLNNGEITVKDSNTNKIKYLDYVYLTSIEYKSLVDKFGASDTQDRIARLNEYGHQFPKKFKEYGSHYHTILAWARKDPVVKDPKKPDPLAIRGQEVLNKVKQWEKEQKQ